MRIPKYLKLSLGHMMPHLQEHLILTLQPTYSNFSCILVISLVNDAVDATDLKVPISWPK